MFDFLFQKKNKEMQSMAEIIALDLEKLNLSKLAIEKAVMMIARAIAKSDIIVQTDSKQKSSIEYRLNVMPNDHECGTYFWTRIIRELLWAQEALIIPMNGKYYKASAWQVSNSVLSERIYGNITLECAGEQYGLPHFKASGEWSLSPLKVPKISVDWYANGGILNSPTIFGANGDSLMGGGEAGKEAVLPIKLLKDYIREENDANNATLAAMIVEAFKSISMTAENNIYIGDKKSITLLTNLVLKQMANKTLATQGAKGK